MNAGGYSYERRAHKPDEAHEIVEASIEDTQQDQPQLSMDLAYKEVELEVTLIINNCLEVNRK